jgi:hypothetical protein
MMTAQAAMNKLLYTKKRKSELIAMAADPGLVIDDYDR